MAKQHFKRNNPFGAPDSGQRFPSGTGRKKSLKSGRRGSSGAGREPKNVRGRLVERGCGGCMPAKPEKAEGRVSKGHGQGKGLVGDYADMRSGEDARNRT